MKLTVHFKPNTAYEYGVRIVGNVAFLVSRGRSIPLRITSCDERKTINMAEIFISDSYLAEVPKFFIGELRMLSPQIENVQRA